MKRKGIYGLLCLVIGLSGVTYPKVNIKAQELSEEAQVQSQISQLETQLTDLVSQIRKQQEQLNQAQADYEKAQTDLVDTESKIAYQEQVLTDRIAHAKTRLVDIQTNNEVDSFLEILLTSSNFSEFIDRLMTMNYLQSAANSKLEEAQAAKDSLESLKRHQEILIQQVSEQTTQIQATMQNLEGQKQTLVAQLEANKDVLANLEIVKAAQASLQASQEQPQEQPSQTNQSTTTTQTTATAPPAVVETPPATEAPAPSTGTGSSSNLATTLLGSPKIYSLSSFLFQGVVHWEGYKFTYYSQSVLPGAGLNIPGRHVNEDGYVADGNGYIVLASSAPLGTIINTPFGYQGKVYDRGTSGNHYDVYIR